MMEKFSSSSEQNKVLKKDSNTEKDIIFLVRGKKPGFPAENLKNKPDLLSDICTKEARQSVFESEKNIMNKSVEGCDKNLSKDLHHDRSTYRSDIDQKPFLGQINAGGGLVSVASSVANDGANLDQEVSPELPKADGKRSPLQSKLNHSFSHSASSGFASIKRKSADGIKDKDEPSVFRNSNPNYAGGKSNLEVSLKTHNQITISRKTSAQKTEINRKIFPQKMFGEPTSTSEFHSLQTTKGKQREDVDFHGLKFLPDHFLKSVTMSKSNKSSEKCSMSADTTGAMSSDKQKLRSHMGLFSKNPGTSYRRNIQADGQMNDVKHQQHSDEEHYSDLDDQSSEFSDGEDLDFVNHKPTMNSRQHVFPRQMTRENLNHPDEKKRSMMLKLEESQNKGNVSICKYCSNVSKEGNQPCCRESARTKKQWVLGKSISIQQASESSSIPNSKAKYQQNQKRKLSPSREFSPSRQRVKCKVEDCEKLSSYFICIGSYKIRSDSNIIFSSSGVRLVVPSVQDSSLCALDIPSYCIRRVSYNFDEGTLVIFLDVVEQFCQKIRQIIEMNDGKPYFSNESSDPLERRIALFMYNAAWSSIESLHRYFEQRVQPTEDDGNQYLAISTEENVELSPMKDTRLLTYPFKSNRASKGAIALTSEDFMCLSDGQFLNDVIIDFYMKYLAQTKLSMSDKRHTHFFSTYFYKRLTRWSSPFATNADDPSLPPAERRHNRVKTWTKDVDIFSKDFIVVPINDKSHWFLAVICFPGYDGAHCTDDGLQVQIQSIAQKRTKFTENEIPLDDDTSDIDEAESESEFEEDTSDEPIIQPSILVFDSLAGPSRSKVFATLREYLTMEYKLKKGGSKVFTPYNCKGSCPIVPQQDNFTDCGIYTLQYAESFFEKPITDYSLPITELLDWFPQSAITNKRQCIAGIIEDLVRRYHPHRENKIPKIKWKNDNGVNSPIHMEPLKRIERTCPTTPKLISRINSPQFKPINNSIHEPDLEDVINIVTPKKEYDVVIVDSPPKSVIDETKASSDRFVSAPPRVKTLCRPIPK